MVVQHGIPRRPLRIPSPVAAIGIFDGVHRGHRAILRKAAARAATLGGTPVAVTFYPHPLTVLRPGMGAPPLLIPLDRRLQEFARCGIRAAWVIPFTRDFCRWTPERFVRRILAEGLRVREVVVGRDFGFGAGRAGNVETLRRLGRRYGFKVHAVAPVRLGGARISSRGIRERIAQGRMDSARRMLGCPPAVTGRVVRGSGRGRSLGFPTANLHIEAGVLPPIGVYAVRAKLSSSRKRGSDSRSSIGVEDKFRGNDTFLGMANLGFRPTFVKRGQALFDTKMDTVVKKCLTPILEVHLFGRQRPLYGRRLEVEFRRRLRPERRFPSPQALARQLARDGVRARRALDRVVVHFEVC